VEDDEIRSLVTRLGRPHRSGGTVVERVAILAEGADFDEVMAWVAAHGGEAEVETRKAPSTGLHGGRMHGGSEEAPRKPARFVLPPGALDE
jgi:hypothetical protein